MVTSRLSCELRGSGSLARLAAASALLTLSFGFGLSACSSGGSSRAVDPVPTDEEALGTASQALSAHSFKMVRSAATEAAGCLPNAAARVRIISLGEVELMQVEAFGLPPDTDFDFFVLQVPNSPFGLSWYQGDMKSNSHGRAYQTFIGRFNQETFIVAPGVAPAPHVHEDQPFPDACQNPATGPIHTFHLGLWFNSPADSLAAGCSGATTPFNGDHTAGPQVLSTRNFPNEFGPLRQVQ
jgi:hypothetical protein